MKKKSMNNLKLAIITGIIILLAWGFYITFIYIESIPQSMEKEVFCKIVIVAATQNCHPGVSTHFGGIP